MVYHNQYKEIFNLLGHSKTYDSINKDVEKRVMAQIHAKRPDEFEYTSEFHQDKDNALERHLRAKYSGSFQAVEVAEGETNSWSEEHKKRVTMKHRIYRITDKKSRLQMTFKECKNFWHMLKIAWDDPENPKGFFGMKNAMKRWQKIMLDDYGKDGAYGRSVASQHPVKKNRHGDWRGKKAKIKDKNGKISQSITRLDGVYFRTGLIWPIKTADWQSNGIMIFMPSEKKAKEMLEDSESRKALEIYKKYEHRK